MPTPTDIAGRYELERRLGAGGMSTVFLAKDRVLIRMPSNVYVVDGAESRAKTQRRKESAEGNYAVSPIPVVRRPSSVVPSPGPVPLEGLHWAFGVTVQNVTFDSIIAGLAANKYDLGMSSFTDTKAREKAVDFVTYFSAGSSLMVKAGNPEGLKPNDVSLCGKTIAVEKGTTQESTDIPADTKTCTSAGKPAVKGLSFDDQNGANLALDSGRADGVLADSPVADYAAKQSNGKFVISGQPYGTAPYGIAIPKGNGMSNAVLAALKALMANGTYTQILTKWGIQDGAINNPVINGATS